MACWPNCMLRRVTRSAPARSSPSSGPRPPQTHPQPWTHRQPMEASDMPADMTALAADLAAESAVTRALVAGLDEAGWDTPTPAAGWDIGDQISHLAYFDEVTVKSATDPAGFTADLAQAEAEGGINPDAIAARFRDLTGAQ